METKRPFSDAEWHQTPEPVRVYIEMLEKSIHQLSSAIAELKGRTDNLEKQANRNSQNSNQPPSADGPFKKPKRDGKKKKRKPGGQKGHPGHRQQLLEPKEILKLVPKQCVCGCRQFKQVEEFYIHQQIELPEIDLDITHYVLHKGHCIQCGKTTAAGLDSSQRPGYGPRMSALIAELSGMHGASRQSVKQFLNSVLGVPISTGGIQKVIDRVSEATKPAYDKIAEVARSESVCFIDETSWHRGKDLHWLWVMATLSVALYLVHPNRNRAAFEALIADWQGILVSDNYRLYQKWVNKRQNCLAHFIRKARALSQSQDEAIAQFGGQILKELQLLCHFAKAPPGERKWRNFYSRFILLLMLHEGAESEAGKLARSLGSAMDTLWVFLEEHGVEPTNNRAERALRFGVIWRKRSLGSQSDKGERWVERILSLKETCRLKSKVPFPVLVDLISCFFKEQRPNLAWIR